VGKKTGPNPTDRGKSGTKESLWTDGRGVPLGVVVAGANVNDYKLLEQTLESSPLPRPDPRVPEVPEEAAVQGLCLDADYFRVEIYATLERWGFTAHIRPLGSQSGVRALTPEEREAAGVKARRWVVERTHSWLHRFRALLIRWCKKGRNYLALLHFACGLIAFRASGLLG
jgi:putative transposase